MFLIFPFREDEEIYDKIKPKGSQPARLYGLAKVYKKDTSFRQIMLNSCFKTENYIAFYTATLCNWSSYFAYQKADILQVLPILSLASLSAFQTQNSFLSQKSHSIPEGHLHYGLPIEIKTSIHSYFYFISRTSYIGMDLKTKNNIGIRMINYVERVRSRTI